MVNDDQPSIQFGSDVPKPVPVIEKRTAVILDKDVVKERMIAQKAAQMEAKKANNVGGKGATLVNTKVNGTVTTLQTSGGINADGSL